MKVNVTTRTVRSQQARYVLSSLKKGQGPVARPAKATVKLLTTQRMRRNAALTVQRRLVRADAPAPDENVMVELRERFKPEVIALSEYLDRDLVSLWGYQEVR